MTLAEKRKQWEEGLTPLVEIPGTDTLLVVLEDGDGWYHVHYYMRVGTGDHWDVSADTQCGAAESVVLALKTRFPAKGS